MTILIPVARGNGAIPMPVPNDATDTPDSYQADFVRFEQALAARLNVAIYTPGTWQLLNVQSGWLQPGSGKAKIRVDSTKQVFLKGSTGNFAFNPIGSVIALVPPPPTPLKFMVADFGGNGVIGSVTINPNGQMVLTSFPGGDVGGGVGLYQITYQGT